MKIRSDGAVSSLIGLRQQKGVSQRKLGEIVGVSRDSISLYEKGKRLPSAGVLLDMADYFGVSPRKLYEIITEKQE